MDLRQQLRIDEGLRLKPYRCTSGLWTIGYGWQIAAHQFPDDIASYFRLHGAITEDMAERLLWISMGAASLQCHGVFTDFHLFTERRQQALVNLMFNVGVGTFCSFRKMVKAISGGDWQRAADELMYVDGVIKDKLSGYYQQTGKRAKRIVAELREG
jgi:lysozyme